MNPDQKDILNWLKEVPKTEIHIHLEAIASIPTFIKLNKKYGIDDKLLSTAEYKKRLNFGNLKDFIDFFLYLQTFFREEEDFALVCKDIEKYARKNKIYYMEAFISPSMLLRNQHVRVEKAFEVISRELAKLEEKEGIVVKLIVDVSRTFGPDNAMQILDMFLGYLEQSGDKRFIGIGLGGAEAGNSCAPYKEVFEKARQHGLHTVAHAGEEVGSESIWDAIKVIGSQRIGHGTSAMFDEELISYLKETQVPLEICPTSNIITKKYVQKMNEHPFRMFFDRGLNVTVNTDDPVLFTVDLIDEYYNLHKHLGFTQEELLKVLKNGLYASFLSQEKKDRLWEQVEKMEWPSALAQSSLS